MSCADSPHMGLSGSVSRIVEVLHWSHAFKRTVRSFAVVEADEWYMKPNLRWTARVVEFLDCDIVQRKNGLFDMFSRIPPMQELPNPRTGEPLVRMEMSC